ncbi:NUDIX domain-containing protein [Sphingomonas panni]|uniref:NUDIX domain-containing protein n=1 Tax=Sphingomonas panni TaxID=237612 RepID=UPI003AFA1A96
MDEAEFFAGYDAASFSAVVVTVDVVPLTFHDGRLRLLVARRTVHPERGRFALPGTFVRADETLEVTSHRTLREKAGFDNCHHPQPFELLLPDRYGCQIAVDRCQQGVGELVGQIGLQAVQRRAARHV